MTMTNLITPPLELVQRVATTLHGVTNSDPNAPVDEWMPEAGAVIYVVAAWLREQEAGNARAALAQPKPPSLKERALHELAAVYNRDEIDDSAYDAIRLALEALPND